VTEQKTARTGTTGDNAAESAEHERRKVPFRTPEPHKSEPPPEGERVEQPPKEQGHRHRPTPGGAGFSAGYVGTPVSNTNEDKSLVKPKDSQR